MAIETFPEPDGEDWAGDPDPDGSAVVQHWQAPKVRRAIAGLIFVVGVFVIAPVVAMFMNAG